MAKEYFTLTPEKLSAVSRLSKKDQKRALRIIGQAEWEHCADDIFYWLDPSQHVATAQYPEGLPYVFTKDPHPMHKCALCEDVVVFQRRKEHLKFRHGVDAEKDSEVRGYFHQLSAIRPFYLLPYMPPIIEAWLQEPLIAIEKSRDMMATWLVITMYTWHTLFHEGVQNIFQSEDSTKTRELVERADIIYSHQPGFLRMIHPAKYSAGQSRSGELKVLSLQSEILGFPQGADQIRQYHPSGVFQDEAAFQVEAGEAFGAIKPAIQNGGRFTAVSSANPSWFMHVCKDTLESYVA